MGPVLKNSFDASGCRRRVGSAARWVWLALMSASIACGGEPSASLAPAPDGGGAGGDGLMANDPTGVEANVPQQVTPGTTEVPPLPAFDGPNGGEGNPSPPNPSACSSGGANASGYCWGSVAIGGGGFVSGIVMSKQERNLIYARTDVGGAYRWNESSQSWLPLTDWVAEDQVGFLGVESIALDPSEPSRLYMLVGISYFEGGKTAILSSTDYGSTFAVHEVTAQFKAHGNGPGRQNGERLAVDPNQGSILYAGTRDSGLFRSADRGATWSPIASLDVTTTATGNGIAFVSFDPTSGQLDGATRTLYAGVSRAAETNLYVSTDAGSTWTGVPGQPTTYAPQRAALGADGTLFITYGNGAGPGGSDGNPMDRGEVWKFEPATGSFTEITPLRGADNRAFGGIGVDATNPSRLLASTINTYREQPWGYGDRIFLSTDAGASWVDLFEPGRVLMDQNGMPWIDGHAVHWAGSLEIDPFDSERAFVTSGNGIFMTNDLGAASSSWAFAVKGLEETVPLDAVSLPGVPLVSAIGDYDGFVHDDPAQSPAGGVHEPAMGTTQGLAAAALAPERWARAGSRLYLSTDGARSWFEVAKPDQRSGGRLAYSADGSVLLWAVGAVAYRTADQGNTWSTVAGISFDAAPSADTVNSSKFYAYDPFAGALYVSIDAGQTFATSTPLPAGGSRRISTLPGVEGDVWIALNAGGLTRSVDSGSSFQRVAGVDTCRAVGFGAPAPGRSSSAVYIWGAVNGGPRGVYRSDDTGVSWQRINDDAHQYGGPGNGEFIIGDASVYGRVFMSTAGRGIVRGELAVQ
jgi:xyloglucan-specific exo-beta-1,4-glucanase